MTTPDHNESKPRRRWPTYLAVVLLLLLVVYPLSIGPAHVFITRMDNPILTNIMVTVYWPIIFLVKTSGTLSMLQAYVDWWFYVAEKIAPQ